MGWTRQKHVIADQVIANKRQRRLSKWKYHLETDHEHYLWLCPDALKKLLKSCDTHTRDAMGILETLLGDQNGEISGNYTTVDKNSQLLLVVHEKLTPEQKRFMQCAVKCLYAFCRLECKGSEDV